MASEAVPLPQLHAKLRSWGAQFMPDRSSSSAHIYWSGPSRKWIKVVRHKTDPGNFAVVSFHNDCPCSGG